MKDEEIDFEPIEFEESPVSSSDTIDFEPIEFEEASTLASSEPIITPDAESRTISSATPGAMVPGAIEATGRAVDESLVKTAEKFGPFSRQQLETVKDQYQDYKNVDLAKTREDVQGALRNINEQSTTLQRQAVESIPDKAFTAEKHKALVSDTAKTFARDIDPDLITRTLEEQRTAALESASKNVDAAAKQSVARQQQKIIENQADEFIQSQRNANLGTISEDQLQRMKADKIAELYKNPPVVDLSKTEAMLEEYKKIKPKAISEEDIIKGLSGKTAQKYPELVGKGVGENYLSDLNKVEGLYEGKFGKNTVAPSGKESWDFYKDIREMGWKQDGTGVKKEVAAEYGKNYRDFISEVAPESSEKFKEASDKINELKRLKEQGYLSRPSGVSKFSPESVVVDEKNFNRMLSDLNDTKFTITDDNVKRMNKLAESLPEGMKNDLQLAVIKRIELDPKFAMKFTPIDALGAMSLSPAKTAVMAGVKTAKSAKGALNIATLAEKASDLTPNVVKNIWNSEVPLTSWATKTGKNIKAVPVVGAAVGGLIGAYSGYKEATGKGYNPWQAAGVAALEAVNPTPVSVLEMKEGFEKNVALNDIDDKDKSSMLNELIQEYKSSGNKAKEISAAQLEKQIERNPNSISFAMSQVPGVRQALINKMEDYKKMKGNK